MQAHGWVKCTSDDLAGNPLVYLNLGRAAYMRRDGAKATLVVFGDEFAYLVRETPEELIARADEGGCDGR